MLSNQELIRIQVETLFTHTPDGRLLAVNEPNGRSAPRFFLGRTTVGNLNRFHDDLPQSIVRQLTRLAQDEPTNRPLHLEPKHADAYKNLLQAQAPLKKVSGGPAYHVPIPQRPQRAVTKISRHNTNLLPDEFGWLRESIDQEQPCLAVVEDGRVVSICRTVRIGAQAHEAGVETLAEYRGRGFAVEVVKGWATAVHELGCIPLYSTSWENKASQRVAEKSNMLMYGVTFHIT